MSRRLSSIIRGPFPLSFIAELAGIISGSARGAIIFRLSGLLTEIDWSDSVMQDVPV